MSIVDKIRNKAQQISGRAKERTGRTTDNRDLQAEGRGQRTKGDLSDAGEKVKDAFRQ